MLFVWTFLSNGKHPVMESKSRQCTLLMVISFLFWDLKGLCHGSPVHFANYSPSSAMERKVRKEIKCK